MLRIFFLIVFFFSFFRTYAQISGLFKGDLIGFGWNNGFSDNGSNAIQNVDCTSCLEIKNVFVIAIEIDATNSSTIESLPNTTIFLENQEIKFNDFTRISHPFFINPSNNFAVIHFTKFENLPILSSYQISIPDQSNPQHKITGFYFLIECIKSNTTNTSYNLSLNLGPNPNVTVPASYPIETNIINTLNDVGFSVVGHTMNYMNGDASEVTFNDIVLGRIAGQDNNSSTFWGSGVRGHFNYSDGVLMGLDDDDSNQSMNGTDALSNVKNILLTNSNYHYSVYHELNGNRTNYVEATILSYTTTCDTFSVSVPNDTTICSGESLQLNVLGGQSYEWSSLSSSSAALADLSCTDCPNPVFSGDTSRFYTVRIRNNDSCSVVRPIKINVRPKPTIASLNIQPSECGTASGSILMNVSAGTNTPISYTLNGSSQSSSTFNGLTSGSYTLSFTDGNGCQSKDSVVFIPEVITTIADFSMSPDHGVSPLIVSIINESINATDYAWSVNGSTYGSSMSAFTFDTSGVYTIELIAWQSDTSCSDTFSVSIVVIDSLIIPTIITPNQDGKNDEWILQNVDQLFPDNEVIIFNRWGSIVFESEKGKYEIKPWDGTHKGKELPMGTYFYIIRTALSQELRGYISLIR